MKNTPIASPLYILREYCAKDLRDVLTRLKAIGFDGVEFLGFFGHTAQEIKGWLDELDLRAVGDFVSYKELNENAEAILSDHALLGCGWLSISDLPMENFAAVSARLDELAALAKAKGIRLQYHNHDQELIEKQDGQEVLAYIMDHTVPETLALEPDLGWIEIGGGDCAEYLRKYAARCEILHFKDYYATDRSLLGRVREFVPQRGTPERGCFEFRPTGYGIVDFPALMPLCAACSPRWVVCDDDLAYERDPFEDLRLSLNYTRALLNIHQ